jgi:hypothetical protein
MELQAKWLPFAIALCMVVVPGTGTAEYVQSDPDYGVLEDDPA